MGLAVLILGLVVFLGAHGFVMARAARSAASAQLGDRGYKIAFSLLSLAGLVLIVWGYGLYRKTGWMDVWFPPAGMRHATVGLMWVSIVMFAATYLPGHIKAKAKHPMLAGIKIWAFAHLLANGDLGSIVLFGSFLAWAVVARMAVQRREAVEGSLPAKPVTGWGNDILAVVVGTLVYLALGYAFHPVAIGVSVFGG